MRLRSACRKRPRSWLRPFFFCINFLPIDKHGKMYRVYKYFIRRRSALFFRQASNKTYGLKMKKRLIVLALAAAAACSSSHAAFKDFTVDGELVTKGQQKMAAAQVLGMSPESVGDLDPQLEQQIKQRIIEMKALAQYAKKQGVDKDPNVRDEIQNAVDMILMQHAAARYLKQHPVSEEDVKAEYRKEKEAYGDKEYRVRHVLLKTQKEAEDVIAQASKGVKLASIAAEKSIDKSSAASGGILDWTSPNYFTKDLAESLKKLKEGEMLKTPVKSPAGWHVVKLEGIRKTEGFPAYEEYKDELERRLAREKLDALISEFVRKADVKDAS